jgi:hypothetical protein
MDEQIVSEFDDAFRLLWGVTRRRAECHGRCAVDGECHDTFQTLPVRQEDSQTIVEHVSPQSQRHYAHCLRARLYCASALSVIADACRARALRGSAPRVLK